MSFHTQLQLNTSISRNAGRPVTFVYFLGGV